jgi:hypothetical protein
VPKHHSPSLSNVTGQRVRLALSAPKVCDYCGGGLVTWGKRGPEPTYCSGRCRVAAFRKRRTDAAREGGAPAVATGERRMGKRANQKARRALRGSS